MLDLTKIGDFSTLFHQYGADVVFYYTEEDEKPWQVSIVFSSDNSHYTREVATYEEVLEALNEAYALFLREDTSVEVVA